jgi:hypothetical protein
MKTVEITHPGTPPKDDPQIVQAMAVWDNLTGRERREVFRTLARTVAAYKATGDVAHLTRFADSIDGMVRLEAQTNLRNVLRRRRLASLSRHSGQED